MVGEPSCRTRAIRRDRAKEPTRGVLLRAGFLFRPAGQPAVLILDRKTESVAGAETAEAARQAAKVLALPLARRGAAAARLAKGALRKHRQADSASVLRTPRAQIGGSEKAANRGRSRVGVRHRIAVGQTERAAGTVVRVCRACIGVVCSVKGGLRARELALRALRLMRRLSTREGVQTLLRLVRLVLNLLLGLLLLLLLLLSLQVHDQGVILILVKNVCRGGRLQRIEPAV